MTTSKTSFIGRHWGKILLLFLVLCFFLPVDDIEDYFGLNDGRIAVMEKMGRLAPFPTFGVGIWTRHHSSWMTQTWRAVVKARPDVIESWLQRCPGVQEGRAETFSDGSIRYHLKAPNGGFVDVTPDKRQAGIEVRMAWDGPDPGGTPFVPVPAGQQPLAGF